MNNMKQLSLLLIISFIVSSVKGQTKDSANKCPVGQTYLYGLESSGMSVENGCWPDSLAKVVVREFEKELCEGELGMESFGNGLSESHTGKYNDSTGCVFTDIWQKEVPTIVKGKKTTKWVSITHDEYSKLCKCEFSFDSTGKQIPLWK